MCLSKHRSTDKTSCRPDPQQGRPPPAPPPRWHPASPRSRPHRGLPAGQPPGSRASSPPWFWGRFLGFLPAGTELVSPDPPGRLRCSGTAPVSGACQRASGTRLSVCLSVCQHASVPLSCELGPVPAPPAAPGLPQPLISQHQAGWDRLGLGAGSRAPRAELPPAPSRSDGQRGLGHSKPPESFSAH